MDEYTLYEKEHNTNFITSFLHAYRYKWILSVFNNLVNEINDRPITVVDIGCGPCKLFKILNENKFRINYIGIDKKDEHVDASIRRYGEMKNFKYIKGLAEEIIPNIDQNIDIITALETFEHIPEFLVPSLLRCIAEKKPKIFACSVPVEVGPAIWIKNVGSKIMGYKRFKEYKWSETFWAGLYQLDKVAPHGTGHKGFDWRWLKHNIRQNMKIKSINKSPFSFIPASLAPSVCFTAVPLKSFKKDNLFILDF